MALMTCGRVFIPLSTGGRCIALSTPNGVGNWFHKTYTEAETGLMIFTCKTNVMYTPNETSRFDKETNNMSKREIAQELECSFNASKLQSIQRI